MFVSLRYLPIFCSDCCLYRRNSNMYIIHIFIIALCYIYKSLSASCDVTFVSKLNITTIGGITATYVTSGTKVFPNVRGCQSVTVATVDLCRLTMQIPISNRSSICMGVWLPDNWDGRYVSTGNEGLAGCKSMSSIFNGTVNGS
jgi:hypothetical protein